MSSVTAYLLMGAHGSSSISDKVKSRGFDGTVGADAVGTVEEDAMGTVGDKGAEGFRAVDEDVAGETRRVDDDDGLGDLRAVGDDGAGDFQTVVDDWTEGSLFLFDEPGGPPPGSLFLFNEPGGPRRGADRGTMGSPALI
jgi:hypothetical protein